MDEDSRDELEKNNDRETGPQAFGDEERGHRPRLDRRTKRWVYLIACAILIVSIWVVWRYYSVRESTDDAQIDGHISPVSARVGGTIIAVNVIDNQFVDAGTVLVQLDPRDYQVALAQEEANLSGATANSDAAMTGVPVESVTTESRVNTTEASLRQAEDGVSAASKEVDTARARSQSAQARMREAEANYAQALKDLERYKKLIGKDEISQQQYDTAATNAEASRAVRDSARAGADEAEKEVEAAEARLSQSRNSVTAARAANQAAHTAPQQMRITRAQANSAVAKVQQARAAVDEARLHLEYTTVKAPLAGWVTNKTVQLGQVVQEGQGLLAIVPLTDIWVTANYKETQLREIRPGMRAEIYVDALGRSFRGHVDSIAAATGERFSLLPPENASGNFVKVVQRVPVKILFEPGQDPQHLLRIGLSVEPTIILK